LTSALPFLSDTRPQLAILSFNLKGEPSGTISLALQQEIETNLSAVGRLLRSDERHLRGDGDAQSNCRIPVAFVLVWKPSARRAPKFVVRRHNGDLTSTWNSRAYRDRSPSAP